MWDKFLAQENSSHVVQQIGTIFKLIQDIKKTNFLTKKNAPPPGGHFHEDQTISVDSIVLTRKNDPRLGGHVFQATGVTRKIPPPPDSHVFQQTGTIFELIQDIIRTNVLTKFHYDSTINVTFRVKIPPHPGCNVFRPTKTIFELVEDIVNVNARVFTDGGQRPILKPHLSNQCSITRKTAPPPWRPYINKNNLFTKFHDDWANNVSSRMQPCYSTDVTIFELIQDIIETNLLTKFHEDLEINVASREKCPPPGDHVFQPTGIIFELVQYIIGMNLLTKLHEDQTINVASRVLTRFYYSHIRKNAPPLDSHVFSSKYIIETNLLTKFHEDLTINVASRE
ncbi:hypothetical protein DPMN_096514 [Dreissena polymorpha]|uniref:Uncharacterized protein n=1 Tax=Dreissena polymorpha TaxID=45954 RepID=A0A9D4LBH9_DREPO|nr:hypothetical protein DPMN_096514 [Dreissena polymorpha]